MKAKDLAQLILGCLIVVGFFGLLIVLAYVTIPTGNKDMMLMVVGGLIGSFATVVGYYYGSSSSSAKKDETIDSILNKPQ
jgi:heme O synthase-like polyprenyltransferase